MPSNARNLADQASNLITISTGGSNFVTPQVLSASISNIDLTPYATKAQLSASVGNINMSSAIVTASSAAVAELNNRIIISSASPAGVIDGRIWVDPTTASAPILQTYGAGQFRRPIISRSKAVGGSVSQVGMYTIHTFTSTSNFIPLEPITVDYLIVAGGGGGATDIDVGGGGGAGGMITGSMGVQQQSYAITVGSGGSRGSGPDNTGTGGGANGTQGGSSSFNAVTATGGGFGGTREGNGGSGGSGGGGGDNSRPGGSGIAGQGNNGGSSPGMNNASGNDSGGGGGAGSAASLNIPGVGLSSSISGTAVTYAAGGRGAQLGGLAEGTINTGNGGSGARNGGSGIVIIRYLT